ncbi:MAG: hypothetical protein OXD44_09375 [Gammaproteobacteria bacterium]|nr:hypothetical protein [Gammaproteobacteria bacterium]MCY4313882.1 hypothetical protein [Gammaproteobacteria bacterium]
MAMLTEAGVNMAPGKVVANTDHHEQPVKPASSKYTLMTETG